MDEPNARSPPLVQTGGESCSLPEPLKVGRVGVCAGAPKTPAHGAPNGASSTLPHVRDAMWVSGEGACSQMFQESSAQSANPSDAIHAKAGRRASVCVGVSGAGGQSPEEV